MQTYRSHYVFYILLYTGNAPPQIIGQERYNATLGKLVEIEFSVEDVDNVTVALTPTNATVFPSNYTLTETLSCKYCGMDTCGFFCGISLTCILNETCSTWLASITEFSLSILTHGMKNLLVDKISIFIFLVKVRCATAMFSSSGVLLQEIGIQEVPFPFHARVLNTHRE